MEEASLPTVLVFRLDVEDLVFELQNLPNFFFFQEPTPRTIPTSPTEIHLPVDALSSSIWDRLQSVTQVTTRSTQPDRCTFWTSFCSSLCLLKDRLHYVSALAAVSTYLQCDSTESTKSTPLLPEIPKTDFEVKARQYIENNQFVLCPEGVGGTYFIQDSLGQKFGVFKPIDEEPGGENNPKKIIDKPLLPPGGGAIREVAAFALDRGFAGVPPTFLVEDIPTRFGPKTGSVQQFIPNDGESSSVGSSSFILEDVQRIGILDIRLFNLDRNGENMLIAREGDQHHLIPIDHAYILPPSLDGAFFEWMYWPQAKKPFSPELLEFIKNIDPFADAALLRDLGIPEPCIKTMVVSTILLQRCASIGKSLFEIASLVCRDISGAPSALENLVSKLDVLPDQTVETLGATFRALVAQEFQ